MLNQSGMGLAGMFQSFDVFKAKYGEAYRHD